MDSDTTKEPPNSNEDWFNQESDMILTEQLEVVQSESAIHVELQAKEGNSVKQEAKEAINDKSPHEKPQISSAVDCNAADEHDKDVKGLEIDLKTDLSPDELDAGNEFLPPGCEINSPEFNDDQEVEIINAFKQDDGDDPDYVEGNINNATENTATTKTVSVGNEFEPEDSETIQNSDKNVQTEQVRRQQSCSSRASLDSQRSISFFVDFDDCDINGNDSVFPDKVSKHRRVKHKNGDKMTTKNATVLSSNNKNVEVSKSVGFKSNSRIDDRTITRRAKGEEHSTAQTEKDDESTRVPTYRAQSAKNRETSRMTQSMYVIGRSSQQSFRSDSQSSGVSFFVDLSGGGEPKGSTDKDQGRSKSAQKGGKKVDQASEKSKRMVKSMSREEWTGARELEEASDDMRAKSRLLLSRNLDQTKTFFKKLKEYINFLSAPSYSKDELRQKRQMAEKITRLMFEEEQRLGKGFNISDAKELDQLLLGATKKSGIQGMSRNGEYGKRPLSAYNAKSTSESESDRPTPLRREKTFDLDPKTSIKDVKLTVTDIPINFGETFENTLENRERQIADPAGIQNSEFDNAITSPEVMTSLQIFQQQRLLHTKRLRREIARLEKMERDIAIKTTQISEMVTPEPKSRNCWTPSNNSRRDRKTGNNPTERSIEKAMSNPAEEDSIQRAQSRNRGRLPSDEQRSSVSSCDNHREVHQARNVENKSSRKTTFQTVANKQDNRTPQTQNRNYQDLTQLSRPGKFNVTIREKIDQNTYAERPTSSGASSACSWFISNDTHNARIGTDNGDIDNEEGEDRIPNENAIHVLGGHNSQLICSNQSCGNQVSAGTSVERASSVSRGMQTGNSLLRQYKEKKDKGCWVRDRPQAYFLFCEESETTCDRNNDENGSVPETPRADKDQNNRETPLEPPTLGRSRTASPYIENNFGSGTVVRRRIIDQIPKDPSYGQNTAFMYYDGDPWCLNDATGANWIYVTFTAQGPVYVPDKTVQVAGN